jgi:hypothetical protein
MYADDGLIFLQNSNDLSEILRLFEITGVKLNKSKSK